MSLELIIFIIIAIGSMIAGIYLDYKKKINNQISLRDSEKRRYEKEILEIKRFCDDEIHKYEIKNKEILNVFNKKEKLFNDINNINDSSIKKISSLFSDYQLLQYDYSAKVLAIKQRPAHAEAKRIKELKNETKNYIEQYKLMMYKYEYLLNVFPELVDYVEDFESIKEIDNYSSIQNLSDESDLVRKFITKNEYLSLSEHDRNQLALNNYVNGKKSNWQIGRDYELFCGQYYEKDGWEVSYFGMEKKLNDLGRDLIAKKGPEVHVIQCKYWSQDKLIHEKHILQLFATTYILQQSNSDLFNQYKPVFITNINLSETALDFAEKLNVKIIKLSLTEFPRIKCNVNGNSKIYHLPFDQKYDLTQIKNKDEFYAMTVKEAESKGFRRAFKYYG